MRNYLAMILLAIAMPACQSGPTRAYESPGPYAGGDLFSPGIYQQKIRIQPRKGSAREFRGVLSRKDSEVEIAGLSLFGTSLFRIRDDARQKIGLEKVEIFEPALARYSDRISEFYRAFRPLLLHRDPSPRKDFTRYPDGRLQMIRAADLEIEVVRYDRAGRAALVEIRGPAWAAQVELTEFIVMNRGGS